MLTEYIEQYKKAIVDGDKKTISRIERELSSLGIDAHTLRTLVKSA